MLKVSQANHEYTLLFLLSFLAELHLHPICADRCASERLNCWMIQWHRDLVIQSKDFHGIVMQ